VGPLELGGLGAGLLGAVLFGCGAVAQAHGVRRHPVPPSHLVGFVARSVRDPWTWLVLTAYLGGATASEVLLLFALVSLGGVLGFVLLLAELLIVRVSSGLSLSVAGVFTIVNESGQTIRPGDLLEFGLPVGPPAQQGIPPQKMRFTVKKARTHDELLDVAEKAMKAATGDKKKADAAIKAYRDAHSRIIGTAMSFSMKGDRLDIKLHSRRSI